MVSTSKKAAGGSGVAAGPSSTACTDHTGINAEHLVGSLPIPTSCPATRKQKGVSDSSAKALRKGPQYDRNWAGKKQTWYGFLLAQNSCQLYPLQKSPANANGRLRRSNAHSLLAKDRCYRRLATLVLPKLLWLSRCFNVLQADCEPCRLEMLP